MDGPAQFQSLFLECSDNGHIDTDEQWHSFVAKLVSHGCIDATETSTLFSFWDNQKESATAFGRENRKVALTFPMFETFVLRLADKDPLMAVASEYMESMTQETNRLIAMGNRWGTEGLDEAHARQLQQLLRDVSKLDQVVLSQVDSCISDQVTLMKAEQDARMILGPIAAQKKERAADGASDPAANCLWFQQSRLRRIEQHLARFRVLPRMFRVEFRHISCNGPHLLGHAPFYRCGVTPRHVEVTAASEYIGVEVGGGEVIRRPSDIALLSSWYATRVDMTRRQCVAKGVPFELEVVRVHTGAPKDFSDRVFTEVAAHRELSLSPYFPNLCGVHLRDRHYASAVYEHVQAASLHSLLREVGGLCETQPTYRFWAQEILQALCHIEEQCCFLLSAPLTLHNVFVSNQGTRITLGRIPWAARVNADGSSCTTQLAARTRLLAQSFAQMLQDMLLASALPGVRRATGLNGSNSDVGKDEEKHGGGDEVGDGGKGVAPQKVFSRMQCMRGIHVRRGETFTIELATRPGGYIWEPPTVVAQTADGDVEVEEPGGGDSLDAVLPAGTITFRSDDTSEAEPVPLACIPLRATHVGSYSLLMYHHRPWEPLSRQPTCVIQVSVHATTASPALQAIIAACERSGRIADGSIVTPPVPLSALKDHPYFSTAAAVSLRLVHADFEAAW